MQKTSIAALGALLLLGATAAVLWTAAAQDVTDATGTATDAMNSTAVACPAQGNGTAALRWAFLVGDGSTLPPFLTLNQTALDGWLSENGLNATTLASCAPHGHAHGFGPGLGPRHARCDTNPTA